MDELPESVKVRSKCSGYVNARRILYSFGSITFGLVFVGVLAAVSGGGREPIYIAVLFVPVLIFEARRQMIQSLRSYVEIFDDEIHVCNETRRSKPVGRQVTILNNSSEANIEIKKSRIRGYCLVFEGNSYAVDAFEGIRRSDLNDDRSDLSGFGLPLALEVYRSSLEVWSEPSTLNLADFIRYLRQSYCRS